MRENDPPTCDKCGNDLDWEDCDQCDGEGFYHDCGEDCCVCLDPDEPNVRCDYCLGKGGGWRCFGMCCLKEGAT